MLKFATFHRQSRTYGFSWIAYIPSVVPATVLTNFELKLKSLKKRTNIADSARTIGLLNIPNAGLYCEKQMPIQNLIRKGRRKCRDSGNSVFFSQAVSALQTTSDNRRLCTSKGIRQDSCPYKDQVFC